MSLQEPRDVRVLLNVFSVAFSPNKCSSYFSVNNTYKIPEYA